MKYSTLFLILFIICGCGSSKTVGNDLLNNYLKEKNGNRKCIIIRQKISPAETVRIFKGQPYVFNGINKRYGGARDSIYNEDDILKMEKRYVSKTEKDTLWSESEWQPKDFFAKDIGFMNREEFNMLYHMRNGGEEIPVYAFSEPMQYGDKYYLLTVKHSSTLNLSLLTSTIIVMYKKNGSWQVVQMISDYIYT